MSQSQSKSKIIPMRPPQLEIPYSEEAESALLGACLTSPYAYVQCREIIPSPDWFFSIRHAAIWRAMEIAHTNNQPLDLIVIGESLKDIGKLDNIGGPAYLTQLVRNTPTSVHAPVYADMVRRLYIRRMGIMQADEYKALCMDGTQPLEQLEAHLDTMRTTYELFQDTPIEVAGKGDLNGYMDRVEAAMANPEAVRGIPTGYPDLDRLSTGWQPSTLVAVGGYTGMGKTSTLLAFTIHAALGGFPVAYYNVADSTKDVLIGRMIAHLSGVSSAQQISGLMSSAEHSRWMAGAGKFAKLPIYIHDQYGMTPRQISQKVRGLKRDKGIRLVVIDYYQEMKIEGQYKSRYAELEKIASELIDASKTLKLPYLVGAQIGHDIQKRQDKRPFIGDIRDCKRLGEKADLALMIHREKYWDPMCDNANSVEIIPRGKNRMTGKFFTVYAGFQEETGAVIPSIKRGIDL